MPTRSLLSNAALAIRRPLRAPATTVVPVIVAAVVALGLVHSDLDRLAAFFAVVPIVVGMALMAPTSLIYWLAAWLAVAGLLRRVFDTFSASYSGGLGDPLLLVGPLIVLLLFITAARMGALRDRSTLSNAVLVLTVLIVAEAVNPLQGGLLVGVGGLLFLLVPVLAFWIGRAFVDDQVLKRLFGLVAVLAVTGGLYGLLQQVIGLPSWDAAWVKEVGYNSLHVGTVIRSFGTFSSSAEYETFLVIGIMICLAGVLRSRFTPILLVLAVFLGVGAFYVSSRGILVLGVVGLAVMLAARGHLQPLPALLGGFVAVLALSAIAGHFASQSSQASHGSGALVQHQFQGLADPLNAHDSTLAFHFSEMTKGLRISVSDPIGHGTGAVNLAAARFGAATQNTEVDPSNFGVALGLPGLIGYLVVVIVGLSRAYRMASRQPTWIRLAALGLLVATFLQWSNGGAYAVAWLPWLVFGWVDRTSMREERSELATHSSSSPAL